MLANDWQNLLQAVCDFCGKNTQVFEHYRVTICRECADLCREILDGKLGEAVYLEPACEGDLRYKGHPCFYNVYAAFYNSFRAIVCGTKQ